MGKLRDRMDADLRLAGYSPSTRKTYLERAKAFAAYHMRSPEQMGEAEIRNYLLHLVEDKQISRSAYTQIRASLKFLYAVTLHRPIEMVHVPVRRKRVSLPVVLSRAEVQSLLHAIRSPKYAAIMMVQYSGGLRISEACRLRPEDIDSARMLIWVRSGKGGRDRCTMLSVTLLHFLREYWRNERPASAWLFPGQTKAGHASPDTHGESSTSLSLRRTSPSRSARTCSGTRLPPTWSSRASTSPSSRPCSVTARFPPLRSTRT